MDSAEPHTSSPGGSVMHEQKSETLLETLVSHLLASKRSLSSISHVWRANEIVNSARASLEEGVVLGARTGFLRRGIDDQIAVLARVRATVEEVAREGQMEFKAVLRDLDVADANLRQTLDQLRSTAVEGAFRPKDEEQKCLHDFVDEEGVDGLMSALRDLIDQTNDSQTALAESNQAFDDDIGSLTNALATKLSNSTSRDGLHSPLPSLLHSLEAHAQEVADLLESLVRHFDLCVTAIKHTEGGGAAAQSITGDLPAGVDVDRELNDAPPEPITDEERQEMFDVLQKDAAEVDDVVLEIRERLAEMESQYELATGHVNSLSNDYATMVSIFKDMEEVGTRLPKYVVQSREYVTIWDEQKLSFEERMEELDGLKEFYEGFLGAYDGLIIEAARRKNVQLRMEKVIQEATTKLDRLYNEDMAERDAFRQDQGDYLPADIWPGLVNPPRRYEMVSVDEDMEDPPDLPRKVVELALRKAQTRL
ncbi:putative kinase activator [Xylona heveae TC161]|uniref:Autophagy-related protein 17 n=1 Tax=Xylona heveae (strain CBS 132557 / TC161) TaxID=1328760 RepID=A0A165G2M9_XYLHT|nr:putative kinase activator [Xylona heveae TC161]KZF21669.1 putative kinase activator [Xylona heveae TC161]